jgi:uncharacterized protein
MQVTGYVLLGLFAGVLSGLVGSGGGIVIVPALIYLFGLSVHTAQGTTMAMMLPPIGILAAWSYYQSGFVDVRAAIIIALGFFIGGFFGGKLAIGLSELTLRRIFASMLVLIAAKMFLQGPK